MIAKIFSKSSGSFRNRLRYIYGGSKHDHEISKIITIETNCLTADPLNDVNQNPIDILNEMIMEFDSVTGLRNMSVDSDRTIKPVFHAVLSLRPGESLTAGQWAEAVRTYITDLGFSGDNKYVAVMHQDKKHQHVHIVANRIILNHGFPLVSDKNERYKSMASAAKLEDQLGLSKAPRSTDTWNASYSYSEVIAANRDGTIPLKARMIAKIAGAIEQTVSEQGDMFIFVRHLRQQKVYVHLTKRADGQPSGIAYEFNGTIISGRKLKRSRLTFQRLITQECIIFDPTTILELEAEAAKRDYAYQSRTGERYLYFRFTSKTRKIHVKFKPKTLSEREIEAIVEAILIFLSILFGLSFESNKEKERREAQYVEYFPELGLSKKMFDPDINCHMRAVRSIDQNDL